MPDRHHSAAAGLPDRGVTGFGGRAGRLQDEGDQGSDGQHQDRTHRHSPAANVRNGRPR
jgi:hypothetical protein